MIVDTNTPHSKCVSLLLLSLRYYLLILLAMYVLSDTHSHFSHCRSTVHTFASITSTIAKAMLAITAIVLIYFYCNWRFPRTEFYIYYIIHFVVCLFLAGRAVIYLGVERQECYDGMALTHTVLLAAVIMNIGAVFVLVMPLELGIKCLNSGGSLFWAAFWLLNRDGAVSGGEGVDVNDIISLVHLLFFVISTLTFLYVKYCWKTYASAKCWRWVVFISWLAMIGCYVSAMITELVTSSESVIGSYFLRLYRYYGWIEIVLPILLLAFVRVEKGDPRGLFHKLTAGAEYAARVNTALF